MNKIKIFFSKLQGFINYFVIFDRKYFPIFSVTILCLVASFFLVRYFQTRPMHDAQIISTDLDIIADILQKIDESCSILSIKYERNPIDFLTVEKFVGSEIGGLNLAYPKYWKGPYLKDNPEIAGKPYELIRAKDGYFLLPGKGVQLPNGLIIGKDVVITDKISVIPMLKQGGQLYFRDVPIAKKIKFIIGDWPPPKEGQKKVYDFGKTIQEFGEAVPFTKNESFAFDKRTIS